MKPNIQRFIKTFYVEAKCRYCPRRVFYGANHEMTAEEHNAAKVCDICKLIEHTKPKEIT